MKSGQKRPFYYLKLFFELFGTAIVVLCMAFMIYTIVCNSNGRAVRVSGHCILKVATGSMEPTLHDGDYINIEQTDISTLKKGDIISFYSSDPDIYNMINTHRIVRVNDDGSIVTRGDANTRDDDCTVLPDKVIGIYKGKIRFLRWISSFASGRKLLMILVIIPLTVISFYEVITVSRISVEVRRSSENKAEEEKEKYIRELIDKEKQRLYDENYIEVMKNESGKTDESKTR